MEKLLSESIIKLVDNNLSKLLYLRHDFKKKRDDSLVSNADIFLQDILISKLSQDFPNHKFISEELDNNRISWNNKGSYIIIDPIDGTENFVSGLKEWGIGISVFTDGIHKYSLIYLPELNEFIDNFAKINKFESRISGISSSLNKEDLLNLKFEAIEYRITGCSMYNMFCAITGRFKNFENVKGVNCWDVLPGLNIAYDNNIPVKVNNLYYKGQLLFPNQKYKIRIG